MLVPHIAPHIVPDITAAPNSAFTPNIAYWLKNFFWDKILSSTVKMFPSTYKSYFHLILGLFNFIIVGKGKLKFEIFKSFMTSQLTFHPIFHLCQLHCSTQ